MTKKTDGLLEDVQNAVEQHNTTIQKLNSDIETLKTIIETQTTALNTLSGLISTLISQKEEKFWWKGFYKNLKSPNFFVIWFPAGLLFVWGIIKYGLVDFLKKLFI